jgi:hypothetical protein
MGTPDDLVLVVVADSSFAVIELLWQLRQLQNPVCMITRLRLDAALYEPAKAVPGAIGRPRKKGERLPTLESVLKVRWDLADVLTWTRFSRGLHRFTQIFSYFLKPLCPFVPFVVNFKTLS